MFHFSFLELLTYRRTISSQLIQVFVLLSLVLLIVDVHGPVAAVLLLLFNCLCLLRILSLQLLDLLLLQPDRGSLFLLQLLLLLERSFDLLHHLLVLELHLLLLRDDLALQLFNVGFPCRLLCLQPVLVLLVSI